MNAIEEARTAIACAPLDTELRTLERLLHALEAEEAFDLHSLYELGFERFELALRVLREWRLARYYAGARFTGLARSAQHADAWRGNS